MAISPPLSPLFVSRHKSESSVIMAPLLRRPRQSRRRGEGRPSSYGSQTRDSVVNRATICHRTLIFPAPPPFPPPLFSSAKKKNSLFFPPVGHERSRKTKHKPSLSKPISLSLSPLLIPIYTSLSRPHHYVTFTGSFALVSRPTTDLSD